MIKKAAIIGLGGMGGWHYEMITAQINEIEIKGAYDIREEVVENIKSKGLYAYSDADEIFSDTEIDIVIIATPNDSHKDYIIRSLKAGKATICEKPVTLGSEELIECIKVSKDTGCLFSVHQNRRWDRDFNIVKSVISSDVVGYPYFIESKVQGSRGSMHGWRGHKLNGGGMLYDWGVHLIDQLLYLIDSPVISVDAHLVKIFSDEVDDNDKIFIRFENGLDAIVEFSTNCFINHPRWHVSCSNGTFTVDDWDCGGKIAKLSGDGAMTWDNDIVYTSAGPTRTMAKRPPETTVQLPLPKVTVDWGDYYQNIVAVLDGNAELIVKPEECLRVMQVIDAAFLSDEKRSGVSCNI